jgi:cytochrome c-type biogenesis protein CcmE
MNIKVIIAVIVIIVAIAFGASSFLESNIEYGTFSKAIETSKKIQVKGEWVKDQPTTFDLEKGEFHFYLKDEGGKTLPVVFKGAKPNNFEIATSVVVKGKYQDNSFFASEILTKCPSKYEADPNAPVKKM